MRRPTKASSRQPPFHELTGKRVLKTLAQNTSNAWNSGRTPIKLENVPLGDVELKPAKKAGPCFNNRFVNSVAIEVSEPQTSIVSANNRPNGNSRSRPKGRGKCDMPSVRSGQVDKEDDVIERISRVPIETIESSGQPSDDCHYEKTLSECSQLSCHKFGRDMPRKISQFILPAPTN